MSESVKIDSIQLKIGSQTVVLSLDEARELKDVLGLLFNSPMFVNMQQKTEYVYVPVQTTDPLIEPYKQPLIPQWPGTLTPHWTQPIVTCDAMPGHNACLSLTTKN